MSADAEAKGRMRSVATILLTVLTVSVAATGQAAVPSAAELTRAVGLLFAGNAGAAGGDVNADGLGNAADLVAALQGRRSPTQPGPFSVGLRRVLFTKHSETMPDQERQLNTDIWYPANPTGNGAVTVPVRVNVPLADGAANLPLLLFSHGSCGYPRQSLFLTPLLASYGLIVAAPPHPGNSTAEITECSQPQNVADSFVNRPADIKFVIDALLQLNTDPASFLHGAIDPARIGMSGHSFGGLTTLRVAAMDSRVIAGLALAPVARNILDEVEMIHVPMMIQVGRLDGLLADGRLAYDLLSPPRLRVEIDRMTHSPFSDFCLECTPETLTVDEAHLFALRYAVPFVLRYVAGQHDFDAFLVPAAAPPGVQYVTDF